MISWGKHDNPMGSKGHIIWHSAISSDSEVSITSESSTHTVNAMYKLHPECATHIYESSEGTSNESGCEENWILEDSPGKIHLAPTRLPAYTSGDELLKENPRTGMQLEIERCPGTRRILDAVPDISQAAPRHSWQEAPARLYNDCGGVPDFPQSAVLQGFVPSILSTVPGILRGSPGTVLPQKEIALPGNVQSTSEWLATDGDEVSLVSRSKKRSQLRPCKGKRRRFRNLVTRLGNLVEQDPDGFDLAAVELPPSVRACDKVKEKLRLMMQDRAHQIRAETSRCTGRLESEQHNSISAPRLKMHEI